MKKTECFFTLFIFLSVTPHFSSLQAKVKKIVAAYQFDRLISNKKPLILEFYSECCSPCQKIAKQYCKLARKEYKDFNFAKINIAYGLGDCIAQKYNVIGVPVFLKLEAGQEKARLIGFENSNTFKNEIRSSLLN